MARAHEAISPEFQAFIETRVQAPCGVPLMNFAENRDALVRWVQEEGEDGLA